MALGLEQRASLGWIALLRIAAGALFLLAAVKKLQSGFDPAQLSSQLALWQQSGAAPAALQAPLFQFALPRVQLLAPLVLAGEFVCGALLVLGLLSRPAALVALLLHLVYFAASGEALPLVLVPVDLAVLVTGGGRALGVDGIIRARRPGFFLG